MRIYDDDKLEADSIIAWHERRLANCTSSSMVKTYLYSFKKMWGDSFGNLDSVPQDFKDKIEKFYQELKTKETH